jgi:hypothetical protein
MESLRHLAGRLDAAAESVADAGAALEGLALDPPGFAAEGPGRLGELGRSLHAQWSAALAARFREAAAAGARLEDTAQAIRVIATGYHEADEAAARRHRGEA